MDLGKDMKTFFTPKDDSKQDIIQQWLEAVKYTHENVPSEQLPPKVEWAFVARTPSADIDEAMMFTVDWMPPPVSAISMRIKYQIPEPVRNAFKRMGVVERLVFVTTLRRRMARNRVSCRLLIGEDEKVSSTEHESSDGVNPLAPHIVMISTNLFVDEDGVFRRDFFGTLTRLSSACAEAAFMCDELGIRRTWTN